MEAVATLQKKEKEVQKIEPKDFEGNEENTDPDDDCWDLGEQQQLLQKQFTELQIRQQPESTTKEPQKCQASSSPSSLFMRIIDIGSRSHRYSILAKVVESNQFKMFKNDTNYVRVKLADESGCADGFFKGQNCYFFKVGNILQIRSGMVTVVKGHICLELSSDGRIALNSTASIKENLTENISEAYVQKWGDTRRERPRYDGRRVHHEGRHGPRRGQYYRGPREPQSKFGSSRDHHPEQRFPREQRIEVYERRKDDRGSFQEPRSSRNKYDFHQNETYGRRDCRFQEERYYPARGLIRGRPYPQRQSSRSITRRSSSKSRQELKGTHTMFQKIVHLKPEENGSMVALILQRIDRTLILCDETGTIEAYFPPSLPYINYKELYEGNVVVIYSAKTETRGNSRKLSLLLSDETRISKARFNVQFYKSLGRKYR